MSKMIRRTVLRGLFNGAAVTVGLPCLDCFLNNNGTALAANGSALPVCFGSWLQGLGFNPGMWVPEKIGAGYRNNIQLKLFDPIRDKINVYSGMKYFMDGRPHETHTSTYQICTTGAVFDSSPIGPSIDSKVADVIGTRTRFRSLDVALDGSRASWSRRSGASINPSEGMPAALYKRVFGPEFKDPNAAEFTPDTLVLAQRSALSAVTEQRQDLLKQVGASDRVRLDEFFTSVREIENQLEIELQKPAPTIGCKVPKAEEETTADAVIENIVANSKIMSKLISHAMACGQTRVFNVLSNSNNWRHGGSPYNWHSSTHEESVDAALGYQKVVFGFIQAANQIFADFITSLDQTTEGAGTLLDRTLVLWQTDHGDARTHSIEEIPIMTAGSGGGRLKTGIHVSAPGEPCTRVGLTVQQVLGVPLNSWGNRSNETTKTFSEIVV